MAPSQHDEAMDEIEADIAEGADFIMVKPALSYLDVIASASSQFPRLPVVCLQRERRIFDGSRRCGKRLDRS